MKFRYKNIDIVLLSFHSCDEYPKRSFDCIVGDVNDENTSKAYIKKKIDEGAVSEFLICKEGSFVELSDETVFLQNEHIYFCIGKYLCKWNLDSDSIIWSLEVDIDSCLKIEQMEDEKTILVSGEDQLSMVDIEGNILWTYSGTDIFVTEHGDYGAEVHNNKIYIKDWNLIEHILDIKGNIISVKKT